MAARVLPVALCCVLVLVGAARPVHTMSKPRWSIKQGERTFVAGKTGSGKTFTSMTMLIDVSRLIVFDPKDDLDEWLLVPAEGEALKRFIDGKPGRLKAIDAAEFIALLEKLMAEKVTHFLIYIDEVYALIPPRTPVPTVLNTIYTRGRSIGVGVWTVTQRPTWLPLVAMSESEWFLAFKLNLDEDRQRIAQVAGVVEFREKIPHTHGFLVYNIDWEKPIYIQELKVSVPGVAVVNVKTAPNAAQGNRLLVRGKQ